MLYAILKPTVTAALRLYFRRISRNGLEYIDNGKPTLILANHTASFMDAILVACLVRRRIHFFARGDVFGNKWANKILRSIGLLPVYRLSEGRDKLHLNDSSNDEALKILAQGGAVLIFCEGVSDIAKRLKPMKKGPFRLAANAALRLSEAPVIVPLGINYVTPTRPGGDVFLEGGAPLAIGDFLEGSDEAAMAKAATGMMRQTTNDLSALTWHTARSEDEPLTDAALLVLQRSGRGYSFEDTQTLVRRINAADEELRKHMAAQAAGDVARVKRLSVLRLVALTLLAPIALVGWAFHRPVIYISKRIADQKVGEPDFYAPVFLSCALLLVLGWYLAVFLVGEVIYPSLIWVYALPGIGGCGVFYLKVYRRLLEG